MSNLNLFTITLTLISDFKSDNEYYQSRYLHLRHDLALMHKLGMLDEFLKKGNPKQVCYTDPIVLVINMPINRYGSHMEKEDQLFGICFGGISDDTNSRLMFWDIVITQ